MSSTSTGRTRPPQTALRIDRLRELREQRGWSQREFARLCGLADTQIHRYETSDNDPSATYLKVMAEKLGVSADYLLGMTDDPHGHVKDTLTSAQQKLLDAIENGDSITAIQLFAAMFRSPATEDES